MYGDCQEEAVRYFPYSPTVPLSVLGDRTGVQTFMAIAVIILSSIFSWHVSVRLYDC